MNDEVVETTEPAAAEPESAAGEVKRRELFTQLQGLLESIKGQIAPMALAYCLLAYMREHERDRVEDCQKLMKSSFGYILQVVHRVGDSSIKVPEMASVYVHDFYWGLEGDLNKAVRHARECLERDGVSAETLARIERDIGPRIVRYFLALVEDA